MNQDQIVILVIIAATIVMFVWGRWRHDIVALASLLASTLTGVVPASETFTGFGHPAVITVACMLVLSWGLETTGAATALAQRAMPASVGPAMTLAALTGLGAVLSAFMNNVGAMALLMPVAIQIAAKYELPPGKILMPLAFGTILGGMTTLIGTPPNMIVASFRAETGKDAFAMFDFTPVGLAVASVGIVFIVMLGWRIVPARKQKSAASFDTGTYLTEVRVTEDSKAVGMTLREAERTLDENGAQIVGMVRNEFRLNVPNPKQLLRTADILVIEAEPESLDPALSSLGLKLAEDVQHDSPNNDNEKEPADLPSSKTEDGDPAIDEAENKKESETVETELQEVVVMPVSALIGCSASDVQMRTRYGLNLLAISRQGRRSVKRLRSTPLQAGDVLLMQGAIESLSEFTAEFACLPLASRAIRIPDKRKATIATIVMVLAIAGAAFGVLPAAISFAVAVLMFIILRVVSLRKVYGSIDWPVIVLLGALIPVANAMASTGTADLIAQLLLDGVAHGNPILALALILVATMTLSDFMNNAATAAVMCPISISTAAQLGASADSFLMAVAIGASCAFLTPIGHQNNTLILGPGGFRFGDYWRLGLPMEILVVAVSVPLLLVVWPL